MNELSPNVTPEDRKDWRNWLIENNEVQQFIWLRFYKKSSSKFNLSYSDAVDEALCFGWIDGTKRTIDGESYIQYFCPRKKNSGWSKVNKLKVEKLISDKLMMENGLQAIERAKLNGSWKLLDDIEALVVPERLYNCLLVEEPALTNFNKFSPSVRKMMLHWWTSAKREETIQARTTELIDSLKLGLKPKRFS